MSRLLDDDQELEPQQRELTLSTGAILAIFLGLVVLCGVFFGFGYNLGRKSTVAANAPAANAAADSDTDSAAPQSSTFENFKPSPVSRSNPAQPTTASTTVTAPAAAADTTPPAPVARTVPAPARTPQPEAAPPATTRPPASPAISPNGAFVVQIAAISPAHKDDADLLVSALHSKGYEVAERTVPQDKLIHIQVGPFATKTDAEAMRERLIVDGYNAIVK